MKFLVETNVLSELRRPDRAHPSVLRWVGNTPLTDMATSAIVLGEIKRGIEKLRAADPPRAARLDQWYATMRSGFGSRILPFDEAAALRWAAMNARTFSLLDSMLAATAQAHGLILVTRNEKDFSGTGVTVFNPFV